MSDTITATYTKLRSGAWGVRVFGGKPTAGQAVTVRKKSGETKTETIAKVVWSGEDRKTGELVAICAVEERRRSSGRSSGRGRGTWTGCTCGSVEEFEKSSDCATCRHDR